MPSGSGLGLAPEPASGAPRPMTMGALTAPEATSSLRRSPARARVAPGVMPQGLRRSRRLGDGWLVEGLPEGRWAIIEEVHHGMVDGVSGAGLYQVVFDTGPVPAPPVQSALPTRIL